jgi:hypothetical protein
MVPVIFGLEACDLADGLAVGTAGKTKVGLLRVGFVLGGEGSKYPEGATGKSGVSSSSSRAFISSSSIHEGIL